MRVMKAKNYQILETFTKTSSCEIHAVDHTFIHLHV
jgi:hypothetical protein